MRARRLRRERRNSAVILRIPRLGIEPSRSSQPRRSMKYSRLGCDARKVECEVDEEDDADEVVVDRQELVRACVERQDHEHHDPERQDRQDQDEDLVGVAALAKARRLCGRGRHLFCSLRVT